MLPATGARHVIHKLTALAILLAGLTAVPTLAATEEVQLDSAPIDHYNYASLQRGAKLYVNYCIGCHSLKYMRYTRLGDDLGIAEDLLQANIAFGSKLFAPMVSAMDGQTAKNWFNQAVPPDLSLTARARTADWLYTYLRGFYRDPERPTGWNNKIFSNVAMPNVLHSLQGSYRYDETGKMVMLNKGKMDQAEFDTVVADLVNFLVYVGEPARNTRVQIGYGVMIFLSFLLVIVYAMYREYWREVK